MSSSSPTNKDQPLVKADCAADQADAVPMAVPVNPEVSMQPGVDQNGLVVGRWKADIFACCTDLVPNCLMTWCCPCISLAQTLHRVGMYTFNNVLLVYGALYLAQVVLYIFQSTTSATMVYSSSGWVYSSVSLVWSWLSLAIQVLALVLVMVVRKRFRTAFQIPGSDIEDCCCSFWCSCCVMAQMATHAEAYTPNECTFSPKDTLPGYQF
ncbi:hypothetical protein H310_04355 [Aphanomyces invadans]|uniref:PLAC8 family protein n=1 Tax=Aphanomyces invadans TaxID=157072 RepID=A0A024UCM8_9STRA|nr:hypothetical protein H310_04355 [Aphanomyces invadans]ETW03940.1 hypothetical protein H310_04355 [Aphanomyces invadans]|eukprot:XP_008866896.1 hypothetical protein H310_04355 [Aphanomyces invadans]